MKVQTLGLLGHFSTMNPPGPFSPLQGNSSSSSTQSDRGRLRSRSLAPTLAPAAAPPGLAARTGAPRGGSRCAERPGRDPAWLQAHEQTPRGRFPTGALAAAVPGLLQGCRLRSSLCLRTVPARPAPHHGEVSEARPGRNGCKQAGPRRAEHSGRPCSVRTGSAQTASSLQPPDPSSHHLSVSERRAVLTHTAQIQISLLCSGTHTIFAAYIC